MSDISLISFRSADYFVEWREDDIEWQEKICKHCSPDGNIIELDRAVTSLLEKKRFLTLIHDYILYDSNIKKICRHQQFFAVENAIKRINGEDDTQNTGGVIWHTQGSGKSLTMVMLVKKIQYIKAKEHPRFVIVTDRVNLDKQIRDNFANSQMSPVRAATGKGLKTILKDKSNVVVTTLINKFETVCKNHYLEQDSDKFYVLIDEAHRSQYSAMYNYMREVLPNATIIAFTGTPLIAKSKRNTYEKFGDPIHNYTMKRSIEDRITVPLVYEGRKVKQNDPSNTIDAFFESLTENLPDDIKKELKNKYSKWSKLAEASSRINLIAFDIYDHFVNYCLLKGLKAMVVCSSRATAVDVFNIISSLPGKKANPRVVITFGDKREGEDDDVTAMSISKIKDYHNKYVKPLFGDNDEKYTDSVCDDFKNPDEAAMAKILRSDEPKNVKADKIKTRIESELKQVRYDDPLLFEEFSKKIIKTLAEYNESRDADKYYNTMESMADDFRNGRLSRDYPASIANDSDAKAFYGSVITILRTKTSLELTADTEEIISEYSRSITKVISDSTKRDWKHNEVVHKQIHRVLDDCLFEMFDRIGYEINNTNIDVLDLIIDEIMKVAVARY